MAGDSCARIAQLPEVVEAGKAAADLIALWPLDDALQMDNDAKYAENLQVRTTRAFAQVMCNEDVTLADAEYVYEGADAIPGRSQSVVDALLAANDAYDAVNDSAGSELAGSIAEAADMLGADWSEGTTQAVKTVLERVASQHDERDTTQAFAAALEVCNALLGVVTEGAADAVRALPVILAVNELREEWSLPRIFLSADDIQTLLDARAQAEDTLQATAKVVAPLAAAEWKRHREEVLWNPAEAKKKAKEEDEQRNKAELAAKFAKSPEQR